MPGSRKRLVIQTDAAVSPGHSGGPLLLGTKVLGINTLKYVAKGVEGIGFAVHASELKQFLEQE